MSESRPLANTLQQPEATACPLFADGPETRAPNWSVSTFGLIVFGFTLAEATFRLGERALETLRAGMTPAQYALFALSVIAFGYGEGYRALHRRFVPHVIERTIELARSDKRGVRGFLIAPLYVLDLVQAPPRARRMAWISVALIVLAVVLVRELPDPYRGIVDAGVAIALSIGLFSLVYGYVYAVRNKHKN